MYSKKHSVIFVRDKLNLRRDSKILNFTDTAVFLGLCLDSKLQWGLHLSFLAGRLDSTTYTVRLVRQLTDVNTAQLIN